MAAAITGKTVFVVTEAIVADAHNIDEGTPPLDKSVYNARVFSNVEVAPAYMRERAKELYYEYMDCGVSDEERERTPPSDGLGYGFFFDEGLYEIHYGSDSPDGGTHEE